MSIDLAGKTIGELENIVANHRKLGRTDSAYFALALRTLAGRRYKNLDFQKTLDFLVAAARRRDYVSYKDVAAASGLDWSKARMSMNKHLDAVCEYAFSRKQPLLTAIVVNTDGVADGTIKPDARAGFMSTAARLGVGSDDPEGFIRAEQQRVFDYFSAEQAP